MLQKTRPFSTCFPTVASRSASALAGRLNPSCRSDWKAVIADPSTPGIWQRFVTLGRAGRLPAIIISIPPAGTSAIVSGRQHFLWAAVSEQGEMAMV